MKTKISALLLAAALLPGAAQAKGEKEQKGEAKIYFAEKSHDFGSISEKGGAVSHEFEFVNNGDAPLAIISATASCGCTRPTFPTEPVKPGKKGVVKVTFLPDGRPGEFNKEVKLRTNAKGQKRISLKINGVVVPKAKK
jgi:phage-related tail protein